MKKITSLLLLLALSGCAAMSQRDTVSAYGSGKTVYFQVNNPNAMRGEAAIHWLENNSGVGKADICQYLKGNYCNSDYRANLVMHNGNIKVSSTKILKLNVLIPADVRVSKNDIVEAKFLQGEIKTNVGEFVAIADNNCKWDGSGVVCKNGWDYKKDLPSEMK